MNATSELPPGFTPERLLAETAKSTVTLGTYRGSRVILKQLTSNDPYWTQRFTNELSIYSTLGTTDLAPQLRWQARYAFLVDAVDGTPLATERYPIDIDRDALVGVLKAIEQIRVLRWPNQNPAVDYHERIDRYQHSHHLIPGPVAAILHKLVDATATVPTEPQHGDLVPANIIVNRLKGSVVRLIDWEFAGRYLPGWDLALVATTMHRNGYASAAIEANARSWDHDRRRCWFLNLAMVTTRELRILAEAQQRADLDQLHSRWHAIQQGLAECA